MEETKEKKSTKKVDTWEYKDRSYYLLNGQTPLTYTIMSKHSRRYPCVHFDTEKGYERELRYATNQKSIFVDEQKGAATLAHIVFDEGHLYVKKEKRNLQEFLAKHPHNGVLFTEFDPVVQAEDQYDYLELELEAMNVATHMDIDQLEAILRVEIGSKVDKMSTKEMKRDALVMSRNNPALFIQIATDDNVMLRNVGIKAVEDKIISLSSDNRYFTWTSTGRKLMTVPFDEHPYTALAHWFKTDEGMEIYKQLEKRLG